MEIFGMDIELDSELLPAMGIVYVVGAILAYFTMSKMVTGINFWLIFAIVLIILLPLVYFIVNRMNQS